MINVLLKIFIKDFENTENQKVRQKYGFLGSIIGIICNVFLFSFKLLVGVLSKSVSIMADAFNNLSDAGSSIITLLGFKLSAKKPDKSHPFGHGRMEYLSGLFVSISIILVGVSLGKNSIVKIFKPSAIEISTITYIILAGSVLIKMFMAYINTGLGKKIDSKAMKATAIDSLSDCIATTVVIISMIIYNCFGLNVDGYAGLIVAIFILYAGISSVIETINPLMGVAPDKAFVDKLGKIIESYDTIIGIHDLIVHDYGPGRLFASVHAEVDSKCDIIEVHEIIDEAERDIYEKLGCEITIHMDPVDTNDEETLTLKKLCITVINNIDSSLSIHDFRITKGNKRINLIFDVVVPFEYSSEEKLRERIINEIKAHNPICECVITFDRPYA